MKLQLSGGAYQARSVIASAQRCLNLVAEPMPQIQGEPAQFAYYPTPGLTTVLTMPQNRIRGLRQCHNAGQEKTSDGCADAFPVHRLPPVSSHAQQFFQHVLFLG